MNPSDDIAIDRLPEVSQRAIAGLLLRCGLALESEGIGPDERGIDSPNVDKLLWAWAAQLRPDIDELEPR